MKFIKKIVLSAIVMCSITYSVSAQKQVQKQKSVSPEEAVVNKVITALQKQDTALFIKTCLPEQKDFDKLFKAAYSANPEYMNSTNLITSRNMLSEKLKESFVNLMETGKKEGINWEKIELTWSGSSGQLDGKIYQINIPFHFTCNGSEYRVVIDFCTQLASDMKIILPGEFKWEGKTK